MQDSEEFFREARYECDQLLPAIEVNRSGGILLAHCTLTLARTHSRLETEKQHTIWISKNTNESTILTG